MIKVKRREREREGAEGEQRTSCNDYRKQFPDQELFGLKETRAFRTDPSTAHTVSTT